MSAASNINVTPAAGNTYNGKWASFGFTVDRTVTPSYYNVYLNGINIKTGVLATASATGDIPIKVGSGLTSTSAKSVNDLVIWEVALNDDQMLAAHNAMAPYYAPPEVR
jgi:hypothetical protein